MAAASASGNVKVSPVTTPKLVSERVGVTVESELKTAADLIRNSYSIICQFFFEKSPVIAGDIEYTMTGM